MPHPATKAHLSYWGWWHAIRALRWHRPLLLAAVLCACTSMDTAGISEWLSYGPFHAVRIYRPSLPAQHLVLLLSGDGGWGAPLPEIARRLSAEGTLVVGIDVRDLFAVFSRDPASCVSPATDLADLAHYLRQRYAPPAGPPVLIGHSAGATLAWVALAESPAGTFAGALTLSFCADLDLLKPVCPSPALRSVPRSAGVRLLPATRALPAPWYALHGLDDTVCPAAESREFAAGLGEKHFIGLPGITHSYHHLSRWWPTFDAAWQQLTSSAPRAEAP